VSHPAAADSLAAVVRHLVPERRLSVSTWLDKHRVMGLGYPSAYTGPWRTAFTPYLREPMDAFNDPAVKTMVLLFASQIGKTEAMLGMLMQGYGADPGPCMWVMPTLDDVESFSKERLVSALKTCDVLHVGSTRSRTSGDAVRQKRINGLPLVLVGSNSTSGLASRPIQRLFCDEIDVFETTAEGDPLELASQRTLSFRRSKKVFSSTPRIKGASRIEDLYERSDRRELFAPCPRCGEHFVVRWRHVRWLEGDASTAHIEHLENPGPCGHPACPKDRCSLEKPGCGGRIEDSERGPMFAAAQWRATAPVSSTRGYRVWAVVAPWMRLSEIVER